MARFGVFFRHETGQKRHQIVPTFYPVFLLCSQFCMEKNGVVCMSITNAFFTHSHPPNPILDIFKNVQNGKVRSSVNNKLCSIFIFLRCTYVASPENKRFSYASLFSYDFHTIFLRVFYRFAYRFASNACWSFHFDVRKISIFIRINIKV